jgi:hypothetical protein
MCCYEEGFGKSITIIGQGTKRRRKEHGMKAVSTTAVVRKSDRHLNSGCEAAPCANITGAKVCPASAHRICSSSWVR